MNTVTISREKKFIWYRVAKVETTTIFETFREHNIWFENTNMIQARRLKNQEKIFFSFAFVRNPYDRLVSCYANKIAGNQKNKLPLKCQFLASEFGSKNEFKYFVDFVSLLNIEKCDHHIRLQSSLIDLNNLIFIGRLENFQNDFNHVMQNLQIPFVPTETVKHNVSNRKSYQDYYNDPLLVEKVRKIYMKDINLFGYQF